MYITFTTKHINFIKINTGPWRDLSVSSEAFVFLSTNNCIRFGEQTKTKEKEPKPKHNK